MSIETTERPLGLRFATEVDAEAAKAEQDRKLKIVWSPSVAQKIETIVATYGTTTTKQTFSGQWDSGDLY